MESLLKIVQILENEKDKSARMINSLAEKTSHLEVKPVVIFLSVSALHAKVAARRNAPNGGVQHRNGRQICWTAWPILDMRNPESKNMRMKLQN